MELICKHCGGSKYCKAGFSKGKQQYKCGNCGKVFSQGDRREKYTMEQKIKSINLYTEGIGLRTIVRSEAVPTPLLIHWIRKLGRIVKQYLLHAKIPEREKDIAILEVDELFTFYKKRPKSLCLACCGLKQESNS
jgi:transposase-like protein